MRRIVDEGGYHSRKEENSYTRKYLSYPTPRELRHIGDATTDTLQQSSIALEALNSYTLTPAGNGTYAGKISYKLNETNTRLH